MVSFHPTHSRKRRTNGWGTQAVFVAGSTTRHGFSGLPFSRSYWPHIEPKLRIIRPFAFDLAVAFSILAGAEMLDFSFRDCAQRLH
jgi:hypothetical protein